MGNTEKLMTDLVADLEPVRPLRASHGFALAAVGLALTIVLVIGLEDVRADLLAGRPSEMFILSNGLFLILGLACAAAAVMMASPRVGHARNGWQWALAMAALLPGAALVIALAQGAEAWAASEPVDGLFCLGASVSLGLITGIVLTAWLRRGAPGSPVLAGWLTGIAAGCAGVVAFGVHCAHDDVMHSGLWHAMAVVVSAVIGRVVVPPLVKW